MCKPGGFNTGRGGAGKVGVSTPRPGDVFMGALGEGVGNVGGGGGSGVGGSGVGGSGLGGSGVGVGVGGGIGLGALSNGLVFAWGFVEMVWWFWVFVTLRDERREMSARKAVERERKREEDMFLR